ncbi:MAG TPA: adenylyltransferase/cytidyltransferase family protein [Anaerolineae bacterium]|nr:adenylyltransferase/cytidyltransferase family protein [Anaerolineae bacterium]HQK15502.1 adenylyltransferase/cytidyltransferase family protein [Anaerolineae bacterium]
MKKAVVMGSFDDLRARDFRFLEEASKLGNLHVLLWSDETIQQVEGQQPKFPQAERMYILQALRYVAGVTLVTGPVERDAIPHVDTIQPDVWVVDEKNDTGPKRAYCAAHGIAYHVVAEDVLRRFPAASIEIEADEDGTPRKKVVVTGSFDWLHSGHVRFFEETAALGDLYVVVGHDDNIRLLKGEGHPLFPQNERRYMVQSIRYVKQALISSGHGWVDAEPEIARIKPDIYAVNEDGDRPEKRAFCEAHGLEYVVLKRLPKAGLPPRQSTALRGF